MEVDTEQLGSKTVADPEHPVNVYLVRTGKVDLISIVARFEHPENAELPMLVI